MANGKILMLDAGRDLPPQCVLLLCSLPPILFERHPSGILLFLVVLAVNPSLGPDFVIAKFQSCQKSKLNWFLTRLKPGRFHAFRRDETELVASPGWVTNGKGRHLLDNNRRRKGTP